MARLTTCPDRSAAISEQAVNCLRCGRPLKKVAKKRAGCLSGCATIGLISFALALLIGLVLPSRPSPLPVATTVEAGKRESPRNHAEQPAASN